jgi:hypothetical protein
VRLGRTPSRPQPKRDCEGRGCGRRHACARDVSVSVRMRMHTRWPRVCVTPVWLHEQRRDRLPALIRRLPLCCPQCCRVLPRNLRCRGTGRNTTSKHGGGATGGEQWTRRGYGLLRRFGVDLWLTTKGAIAMRLAMRSAQSTNQQPRGGAPWASRCPVASLFLMASTSGDSDSGMLRRVCRKGRLTLLSRVALHGGSFSDSRLPKTESRRHARASRTCRAAVRRVLAVPRAAAGSESGLGGGAARWQGAGRHLRQATRIPGPERPFGLGRALGLQQAPGVQANGTRAVGCVVKGRRSIAWGEPEQPRSLRITGGSCHGGGPRILRFSSLPLNPVWGPNGPPNKSCFIGSWRPVDPIDCWCDS